jgi:hypothetical protein
MDPEQNPNRLPVAIRYQHDPQFKVLVDTMCALIREGQYTPSELREAAIYALTLTEMESTRSYVVQPREPKGGREV